MGNLKVFVLLLVMAFSECGIAQDTPPVLPPPPPMPGQRTEAPKEFNSFKERVYFGGNVGAAFGSITYVNLSPLVGFKLTKKFSIGAGGTYNYYSQNYGGQKFITTVYGSNLFARYFFTENFFGQVGWDRLSVPDYTSPVIDSRTWVDNILLGGGYRQQFTDNASFIAMIFFNANQTPLSPYPNPIIQIGFNIGL